MTRLRRNPSYESAGLSTVAAVAPKWVSVRFVYIFPSLKGDISNAHFSQISRDRRDSREEIFCDLKLFYHPYEAELWPMEVFSVMAKKPIGAEKAALESTKKRRGKPFRKGHSGNPLGKPPGTRNRLTRAAEELLAGEAEVITRKCVDLAKAGDTTAIRLCLDRLMPPMRERRIELKLPHITTAPDVTNALSAVLAAVGAGSITPGEAQPIACLIEAARKSVETDQLAVRIEALERRQQNAERSAKTS